MKRIPLLILVATLVAGTRAEEIIPDFIQYSAPEPFFRAHSYQGAPSKPHFFHPLNGRAFSAELKFEFVPVGWSIGQGKVLTFEPLSWEDLKKWAAMTFLAQKTFGTKLSEEVIDGRKTLILDFETIGNPESQQRHYISRLWIRVEENKVLEGRVACSSDEMRKKLRASLTTIRIHRYYEK